MEMTKRRCLRVAKITWKSKLDSDAKVAHQKTLKSNLLTLEDKSIKAMNVNRTFLSLDSPTNAQILSEVKNLARQTNVVIRLLLKQLDDID